MLSRQKHGMYGHSVNGSLVRIKDHDLFQLLEQNFSLLQRAYNEKKNNLGMRQYFMCNTETGEANAESWRDLIEITMNASKCWSSIHSVVAQ